MKTQVALVHPQRVPLYVVSVHGGAGFHARNDDVELKRVMKTCVSPHLHINAHIIDILYRACKRSLEELENDSQSVDVIEVAIVTLEDDPSSNAGLIEPFYFEFEGQLNLSYVLRVRLQLDPGWYC